MFGMLGMLFAGLLLGLGVAFLLSNSRFLTSRPDTELSDSGLGDSDASFPSPENGATPHGKTVRTKASGSPSSYVAANTGTEASESPSSEKYPLVVRHDTNAMVAATNDMVKIPKKFVKKIHCEIFNATSNVLSDEVVELLQITPDDRERLNQLIAATRDHVEARELEHAVVTEQSPTRVVMKLVGDAAKGQALADSFVVGVRDILGDNADDLLARIAPYDATTFSNFGRYDTTLAVTRDDNTGLLRLESRQDFSTADGSSHSAVSITTLSQQVPERWKKFFQ
jgi:hypothetical protein